MFFELLFSSANWNAPKEGCLHLHLAETWAHRKKAKFTALSVIKWGNVFGTNVGESLDLP